MDEETIDTVGTTGTEVSDPVSDPTPAADPIQVISVDELVERLTSTGEEQTAETVEAGEEESVEPSLSDQYFTLMLQDTTNQELLAEARAIRQEIQQQVHPAMTTPFSEYTVTESLLLLVLIGGVVSICFKMLRRAFSWLG